MFALSMCAIAAAVAGPATAQQATFERPYWLDRAVIETLGKSEIDVRADRARFSVTFREVARESRDAMMAASDRARLATAAIRSRGGDAVHISSSADIEAIHEDYRNREGERIESDRADRVQNYAVSVTLNIVITDVSKALNVRAAAMAVGPEQSDDLTYTLDENAPARLRAYRAAVQDATARARAAAEASGATLGHLLVLQEGQGPCLGRWQQGASRAAGTPQYAVSPVTNVQDEAIVVTGSRIRELRLTAEDIARMQLPEDVPPLQLSAQVCAIYALGQ